MWSASGSGLAVAAALLVAAGLAHAFPWSRDMKDQPSIRPQEAPRRPPAGAIPREGWERPMSREEAGRVLKNPVQATRRSVENGRHLFQIYCALCHGRDGKGMGPVAAKFIPPPDLTLPVFRERTDGFIYGTIRNGGAVMPAHGEVLSPNERWDLVNFVRSLQNP
jgi:mono/diheme cytochrome c family protein